MTIPGTIPVTGELAPTAVTDTYPTHDAQYGRDGWRGVATHADRNLITTDRRRLGMAVVCDSDALGVVWQLNTLTNTGTDADWTLLPTGGGGGGGADVALFWMSI